MERERAFYRKAFEVTGQNSFEEILEQYLYLCFLECLTKYPLKEQPGLNIWRKEVIAKHYSLSLASVIKAWVRYEKQDIPVEEIIRGYYILMNHSIFELIDKKEHS